MNIDAPPESSVRDILSRQLSAYMVALIAVICAAGCLGTSQTAYADEISLDHAAIYTFRDENASITTEHLTDRYYVNGFSFSYAGGEGDVPAFAQQLGHALWGAGVQRISFDLSQQIYTPYHTRGPFLPGDEPYAGELLAGVSLLQDYNDVRNILSLQVGVAGPAAGGKFVQNTFHAIIGQGSNPWCCYQIQNEPLGELTGQRIWRRPLGAWGGLETDVLPDVAVGLGNMRDYALAGAVFRIGQGLESDFGVSRVHSGMSGGDAYTPVKPWNWYVFGGLDAQVVAHDIALDGNTFVSSPSVQRNWFVGEFELGAAVMWRNWRLSYMQVFQTAAFKGEADGVHELGVLMLSGRF